MFALTDLHLSLDLFIEAIQDWLLIFMLLNNYNLFMQVPLPFFRKYLFLIEVQKIVCFK